jgi:hypothetical protein
MESSYSRDEHRDLDFFVPHPSTEPREEHHKKHQVRCSIGENEDSDWKTLPLCPLSPLW